MVVRMTAVETLEREQTRLDEILTNLYYKAFAIENYEEDFGATLDEVNGEIHAYEDSRQGIIAAIEILERN